MSVTVVSVPSKAAISAPDTGTKPAAGAADASSSGQDFASLLLGQLMPAAPPAIAITDTTAMAKNTDGDLLADETALFATLGLIAPQAARNVAPTTEPSTSLTAIATGGAADASMQRSPALGAEALAETKTAPDDAAGNTAKFAGLQPATLDKSAIIAASSERSTALTETTARRSAVADAVSNTLPPAASREAPMSATAPLTVSTPVQSNAWAADVADKIVWLATNDKQSAKLTLNPAHLGPLEISLNIDKGHATATFISASAEVRDALESALPRLREMFANAGISLGQTNVGAETFNQQANGNLQNGAQSGSAARWQADGAILAGDLSGAMPANSFIAQRGNGMVDTFA